MVVLSQNGRAALATYGGPLVTTTIPGTNAKYLGGLLAGDVNLIGMYIGYRWHTEVEPLDPGSCWGYNYRPIRGASSTSLSNHSSGTAGDLNASAHPLGANTLGFSKLFKVAALQRDLAPVVQFGAFYSGRVDEMHWEIVGSDAAVADVANRIRNGMLPNVPVALRTTIPRAPVPTPAAPAAPVVPSAPPAPVVGEDDMPYTEQQLEAIVSRVIDAKADQIAAQVARRPFLRDPQNPGSVITIESAVRALLDGGEVVGKTQSALLDGLWLRDPDNPTSVVNVRTILVELLKQVEKLPKG